MIFLFKKILLYRELKSPFIICGYNGCMVRVLGKRFLSDWEVEIVHKWRLEGKIKITGTWTVQSPHGNTYTDITYKTV